MTGRSPGIPLGPEARKIRSRIMIAKRRDRDADTSELRRDLRAARCADYIARVVDAAPPLTEAQRARLAVLLLAPSSASNGAA